MHMLVLALALAGCGEDPAADSVDPPTEGFAGVGGGLTLAWFQSGADERTAYVCGQGDALGESRWFKGWDVLDAVDGSGWVLELDDTSYALFDDQGERGAGGHAPFTDDGTSGMYDADTGCHTGAIVEDGTIVGTYCDGTGLLAQVEPVGTLVAEGDALRVQVLLADGPLEFDVTRMRWD